MIKKCSKCNNEYPATNRYFFKRLSGLAPCCKSCYALSKHRELIKKDSDGNKICPKCKCGKSDSEFEKDEKTFDGLSKYCIECIPLVLLDRQRRIDQEIRKTRKCIRCNKELGMYSRKKYCPSCKKVHRHFYQIMANRRAYNRRKENKKLNSINSIFDKIEYISKEEGNIGFGINNKEYLKHLTYSKNIEQLTCNMIKLKSLGVNFPDIAAKIAIEYIKGKNGKEISKTIGTKRTNTQRILNILTGELKPSDIERIKTSKIEWIRRLYNLKTNVFKNIKIVKPKKGNITWDKDKLETLEMLLTQGKTPGESLKIIGLNKRGQKLSRGSPIYKKRMKSLYLKFGRKIRICKIITDWTELGRYGRQTAKYKKNREFALEQIKSKIGLHPITVNCVIKTMEKYGESEYYSPEIRGIA